MSRLTEWLGLGRRSRGRNDAGGETPLGALAELVRLVDDAPGPGPTGQQLYDVFIAGSAGLLHKWHHYFEIYEEVFAPLRTRENLRLLEIGVGRGGSLDLWRGYFEAAAVIVGADIDPAKKQFEDAARGIRVRIGDQADRGFLAGLVEEFGAFDIVIDDGGHTTRQQVESFLGLYPAVVEDGIYLVEDVHTSYWKAFQDSDAEPSFMDFATRLTHRLNEPYWNVSRGLVYRTDNPNRLTSQTVTRFCAETKSIAFFDSIIVFRKGRRNLPRNEIR